MRARRPRAPPRRVGTRNGPERAHFLGCWGAAPGDSFFGGCTGCARACRRVSALHAQEGRVCAALRRGGLRGVLWCHASHCLRRARALRRSTQRAPSGARPSRCRSTRPCPRLRGPREPRETLEPKVASARARTLVTGSDGIPHACAPQAPQRTAGCRRDASDAPSKAVFRLREASAGGARQRSSKDNTQKRSGQTFSRWALLRVGSCGSRGCLRGSRTEDGGARASGGADVAAAPRHGAASGKRRRCHASSWPRGSLQPVDDQWAFV